MDALNAKDQELIKLDLYIELGVTETAKPKDINKAYKRRAIELHPDKNKDDPKAHENFVRLKSIYDFLLDPKKRSLYDAERKRAEEARQRHKDMDDRRRRFKEKLISDEEKLLSSERLTKNALDRLQRETQELVDDQKKMWMEKLEQACLERQDSFSKPAPIVMVEFLVKGSYTIDTLLSIFRKYGEVLVTLNERKAMLEFQDFKAADMAVKYEKGYSHLPIKVYHFQSQNKMSAKSARERANYRGKETEEEERARLIREILACNLPC